MVSNQPDRKLTAEAVARWLATLAAALFCVISLLASPFGCAVGEYEEDRNCAPAGTAWVSVAVLVATIIAARATARRSVHWIGLASTVVLAYSGVTQS